MNIRIEFLNPNSLFVGFRFTHTKLVENINTYNPEKEYPRVYVFDIGFLFFDITITKKGS